MTIFGSHHRFRRGRRANGKGRRWHGLDKSLFTLADVRPGESACVINFLAGMPDDRCAHLQAYGMTPGSKVRVVQHSPVTIVQVEHLEIALENELAREVQVSPA